MTIITGSQACPLVEGQLDPRIQVQMCGIELTLLRVERFISAGEVAFDNKERKVSETLDMQFDESGWIYLGSGAYLVTFNEIVNIPRDMAAVAKPRSTLLRSGISIETALWDPGYRGRSQSLLVVYNSHGIRIKKNARLLQLVFMKLNGDSETAYSGIYQEENI
ncbi:MAG: deoxyuridine 5'-triphosphate nucleotidohydrolase [Methanotrichaceae archaeon]|nr:deoxyuridine 5'-triphosphate nucleotidohydrolase [Methanotrichaceae archaeon]